VTVEEGRWRVSLLVTRFPLFEPSHCRMRARVFLGGSLLVTWPSTTRCWFFLPGGGGGGDEAVSKIDVPFHSIPFHSIPFHFISLLRGPATSQSAEADHERT
jgi:hypothetical protein